MWPFTIICLIGLLRTSSWIYLVSATTAHKNTSIIADKEITHVEFPKWETKSWKHSELWVKITKTATRLGCSSAAEHLPGTCAAWFIARNQRNREGEGRGREREEEGKKETGRERGRKKKRRWRWWYLFLRKKKERLERWLNYLQPSLVTWVQLPVPGPKIGGRREPLPSAVMWFVCIHMCVPMHIQ